MGDASLFYQEPRPLEPHMPPTPCHSGWQPVRTYVDATHSTKIIDWRCDDKTRETECFEGNWVQDGVPKRWRCRDRVPDRGTSSTLPRPSVNPWLVVLTIFVATGLFWAAMAWDAGMWVCGG